MKMFHDNPSIGGSRQRSATFEKAAAKYHLTDIRQDVGAYVDACQSVARSRPGRHCRLEVLIRCRSPMPYSRLYPSTGSRFRRHRRGTTGWRSTFADSRSMPGWCPAGATRRPRTKRRSSPKNGSGAELAAFRKKSCRIGTPSSVVVSGPNCWKRPESS